MRYYHKDFRTILDAFIEVSNCFQSKESITPDKLRPLCDYPDDVLKEFLDAMMAVDSEQIENMPQAVEIYVLLRMNILETTRKPLDW